MGVVKFFNFFKIFDILWRTTFCVENSIFCPKVPHFCVAKCHNVALYYVFVESATLLCRYRLSINRFCLNFHQIWFKSLVAWLCYNLVLDGSILIDRVGNALVCSIWLSMLVNDPVLEPEWSLFRTWMILFCGNMMQYHDEIAWWNTMVQ